MARDAIAFFEKEISRLTWKVRQITERHAKKARTILYSMVRKNLKVRSGALSAAVRSATLKTTSGNEIISEVQLNPTPGNPKGYHAVQYAGTQMGTGTATIHSKGKRMAIPIPKGPAWSGSVALYMPSTYPGAIAGFQGSSLLYAVRTLQKTRKLGRGQNLMDLMPTWVLKDSVRVPRRVNPQEAVEKVRPGFLYDLSKVIGSEGLSI